MLHGDLCSHAVGLMSGHRAGLKARRTVASLFSAAYHSPRFSYLLSLFSYFPQGIFASTLSSKLTCANYHRLGMVAHAGERGSRARNARAGLSFLAQL